LPPRLYASSFGKKYRIRFHLLKKPLNGVSGKRIANKSFDGQNDFLAVLTARYQPHFVLKFVWPCALPFAMHSVKGLCKPYLVFIRFLPDSLPVYKALTAS
jgi:hypothetical protein